jgi:hypothetical protein
MSTLRVTTGPSEGQSIECDREFVIGREDADLVVEDMEMSRRHATIRPVAGGLEIEDLGSFNGTFVDGQRISGVAMLTGNASLKMGTTHFTVQATASDVPLIDTQRTVASAIDREQPLVDISDRTVLREKPVFEVPDRTVVRDVSIPQAPGAQHDGAGPGSGTPTGAPGAGQPMDGAPPNGPSAGAGPPGGPGGAAGAGGVVGADGPPFSGPPGPLPAPVRLLMKSALGRRLLPLLIRLPQRARRPVVMLIPLLLIVIVVVVVVVIVKVVF